MAEIRLEQRLPVTSARAWPFLTVPEKMNLWSEASVELIRVGASGRPDGEGSERRVAIPTAVVPIALVERVEVSVFPHMLEYRVLRGGFMRRHRGRITLTDDAEGCLLTWTVRFRPAVPLTGWISKALVRRSLARSLLALAAVLASVGADRRPSR